VVVDTPQQSYSREDVRRMLGVTERQLRSWSRQGLIGTDAPSFSFHDLLALKTLLKLREQGLAPRMIARALDSLKRKLAGVERPLSELKIISDGGKIAVQIDGQRMDAISGQLLLNFDESDLQKLASFPVKQSDPAIKEREAEAHFQHGLQLEETGAPVEQAIAAYKKAIAANPYAAGALVNLGTLYYRMRKFTEAEDLYQRAIQADPRYPLAHFNLGNLFDEMGDTDRARRHYELALEVNPSYSDAHFNLALLCERSGQSLQAVAHWKAYLKLDSGSSWARVARRQLDRLKASSLIKTGGGRGGSAS
jgi:tetratricopeptide (TPR) repeat protein